jgi:hypothetical protein
MKCVQNKQIFALLFMVEEGITCGDPCLENPATDNTGMRRAY